MQTIGILGCGLMGSGIAQVCAQSGYRTIVREVDQSLVDQGLGRIKKFLNEGVKRGKVSTEDRDKVMANLSGTTQVADLAEVDIVIEAIVENLQAKQKIFLWGLFLAEPAMLLLRI